MIKPVVKERITRKLQNTRFKQLVEQEMSVLLGAKPDDVSADEYCDIVAGLIVHELREMLCGVAGSPVSANGSSATLADDATEPPLGIDTEPESLTEATLKLDDVIRQLSEGIETALMGGNLQMVRALGGAIAQRDSGTSEHNVRVTLYAFHLGRRLGLTQDRLQSLLKGALLHDIGKVGIPDRVLLKEGDFNEQDRAMMNSHTKRGADIIKGVKWLKDATDVVRSHHERYDGKGHPDGLIGDAIPLHARIFAVVDVFDALTSERPYKSAMPYMKAIGMLREHSGTHFDPQILAAFVEIAPELFNRFVRAGHVSLDNELRASLAAEFGIHEEVLNR